MNFIQIGAALGAVAVILGAFGAHVLKAQLTPEQLTTYQTGILYHFFHVFALLIVGLLAGEASNSKLQYAGWFFIVGIVLFSGSLYLLSCKSILNIENWKFLGPLTPIGGTFFILGWLLLALGVGHK